MGRPIVLSNGRMLVGLDEHGFVNDFYYPYVGQENLTSARQLHHKIGVWINGKFSWLDDNSWTVELSYSSNALVGECKYISRVLGLEIRIVSFVSSNDDVFSRRVYVTNTSSETADVRVFFHQVFQISRNGRRDTALFVPSKTPYILTYCGDTTFISGLRTEAGKHFDQYAVGNYQIEGKSGTWADAEDGELSNNNVEHGGVDSTLRACLNVAAQQTVHVDYWVTGSMAGYHKAAHTHRLLSVSGLQNSLEHTVSYWNEWLSKASHISERMDDKDKEFFITSLLITKAHIDSRGGVLASADSSIYNYGRDYYSYVWPRDAVFALTPLVKLGYTEEATEFLRFCLRGLHPRGYLHHKYQPDGSIGSTWHPMIQEDSPELNIQEDETAAAILLFNELYKVIPEEPELKDFYMELVLPATEFIASYIDRNTMLPHASYDLWEETFLSSTYTTAIVINALRISIDIAEVFDPAFSTAHWEYSLKTITDNFHKYFLSEGQYYMKGLRLHHGGEITYDTRLDASTMMALLRFQPIDLSNAAVVGTIKAVEEKLYTSGNSGGVVRYQDDSYMKDGSRSNPWFICTLWLAQYYVTTHDMTKANELLEWAYSKSTKTKLFSEQVHPDTSRQISVSPLVWSHAELLETLISIYED